MSHDKQGLINKWALFRFSVIGGLLARPPAKGQLREELKRLASQTYRHPVHNRLTVFHFSTIECWYYKAKNAKDPIVALGRKIRSDSGQSNRTHPELLRLLGVQYKKYPHWSYQLHSDNLAAEIEELNDPKIPTPSYSTVRRRMLERGWTKRPVKKNQTKGQKLAVYQFEKKEQRGFEAEYVHQLWHLDFHNGSRRIVDSFGKWHTPKVLCIIDDRSRLCCHIQWYLNETAEVLFHGLSQAFYKRGLPLALMTDNGAAMMASETRNGLLKLGINHEKTLPYSPYQNGKQEAFWGNLEGRLMAMLKHVKPLSLEYLNTATQAWAEMEYNKKKHDEIGMSPVQCMLKHHDVSRPAPDEDSLRLGFTVLESRKQRRSDGTISINSIRFEIPWRFNHMQRLHVCFADWDKSVAWLVDERTKSLLATIYPHDKTKHGSGKRRVRSMPDEVKLPTDTSSESEPALLRKLMTQYAETGMPAAYITKE